MPPQLRKFDVSSIQHNRVVVLIGNRGTGKSFLVRDLLFHQRDIPVGAVVSHTEADFGGIMSSLFIHDAYTPDLMRNVVKRQEILGHKIRQQIVAAGSCSIDPRSFLVLDDCFYDGSWMKDPNLRRMFMNGRSLHIMLFITMQFPLGIPPDLRAQIDYTFIFRNNLINNRKRIYENYAGLFPTFDVFCQVMDQCTEDFDCIVIDNTASSNRLEDQVFWYKAEPREAFRIGADVPDTTMTT